MKRLPRLYEVPHIDSVQDMLVKSAAKHGDKLALEDLKETPIPKVTFNTLLRNVLRFGAALQDLGLPERSHVAVIGENRVQWGIAYLTALCFNYVVVPIDARLNNNEILNIIHESDAGTIIFSESFDAMLREERRALKHLKHYIGMDLSATKDGFFSMPEMISKSRGCTPEAMPDIDPKAMAAILFTSGTLGRAKGVMLSQRNLASNLMAMVSLIIIAPEDRFLSVLPIHHTYECTCGFLCPLYAGSSVHYARSLKTVVDDLQQAKATILLAVPLLYDKMFKRIYKAIREKKITSIVVPPLIKLTDVASRFGWKGSKRIVFSEIHERFGGHIRLFIAGGAAPDPAVAKGLRDLGFTFMDTD
jgi:long-chain acyl-CoA synthetase